jgi:hypothetical protein
MVDQDTPPIFPRQDSLVKGRTQPFLRSFPALSTHFTFHVFAFDNYDEYDFR